MKKKTKDINVNGREYSYVITQKYIQNKSHITLRISLVDSKNKTCTYRFVTWEDAVTGSPLLVGVTIKKINTTEAIKFNLHHPQHIRSFILYAIDNGWNGESPIEFQDGMDIMCKMGFDVEWLKPSNQL